MLFLRSSAQQICAHLRKTIFLPLINADRKPAIFANFYTFISDYLQNKSAHVRGKKQAEALINKKSGAGH